MDMKCDEATMSKMNTEMMGMKDEAMKKDAMNHMAMAKTVDGREEDGRLHDAHECRTEVDGQHVTFLGRRALRAPIQVQVAPVADMNAIASSTKVARPSRVLIARHSAVTRITHWLNALCLAFLLLEWPADLQRPSAPLLGALRVPTTTSPSSRSGQTVMEIPFME